MRVGATEEAHTTRNLAVATPEGDSHLAPEGDCPERNWSRNAFISYLATLKMFGAYLHPTSCIWIFSLRVFVEVRHSRLSWMDAIRKC